MDKLKEFECQMADNGGWIVIGPDSSVVGLTVTHGAFSSLDDMLKYLRANARDESNVDERAASDRLRDEWIKVYDSFTPPHKL